ncbi:MAG TPA: radical SAM protein [Anaerolineales bacterium]|nr:radical SAM protein [Anaerolineales bacterium]
MSSLRYLFHNPFARIHPLPAGTYHFQSPPDAPHQYRLHLRLDPGGAGLLIVNASTVLHLNQTAAEYAWHLVRGTEEGEVGQTVAARYRIAPKLAAAHYRDLKERIERLSTTPDLDPETYLEFERQAPYSAPLSAPYRLDCAVTYELPYVPELYPEAVRRVRRELSTGEWETILDKAWAAGIPHIIFTGGEPTRRADLADLIGHAERLGQVTGVISDGVRVADSKYLQSLLRAGLDHLTLLLQPESKETWKGIENAVAADLYTTVHLTLTPDLVPSALSVLDRLKGMMVHSLSLSVSDDRLGDVLQAARSHAAHLGLTLVWDLAVPFSRFNPVALEVDKPAEGAGHAWLYLEPDGDVLPAQGHNQVLGNMLNDPWDVIWQKAQASAGK